MAFPDSYLAQSGKYTQIALIGKGACGMVYRAVDNMGRVVAVKEARSSHQECIDSFKKEVRLHTILNHPNIIRVYHLEPEDPLTHEQYLIMEYANGGSLADHLRSCGPLPEPQAIRIALDICAALGAVSASRFAHRDVKPSNSLLFTDEQGQITAVKLGDFGIAKDLDKRRAGQPTTQLGGPHPGTWDYMPPEQRDIRNPVDVRTDLYALGIGIWEMLTDEDCPHPAPPGPPSLPAVSAQASQGIAEVIQRATRADPDDRYQTPQQMAADLRDVLNGQPLVATPTIHLPRTSAPAAPVLRSPPRRAGAVRLPAVGILVACVGLALGGYWLWPRASTPWAYTREGEAVTQSSVGVNIARSHASDGYVYGQFGAASTAPWPAQPGSVSYGDITLPDVDHLLLQVRYSKDSPATVPILVYLDDEPAPRATFNPIDQKSWDQFVTTAPIDLGRIAAGSHTIRFRTDGQRFGVADLDTFTLTAGASPAP
ncbi:serine/threonine protein kinase [Oscillochloris sp. ZM17-4]|uniref:serine/threonine protein kinase n=1 Tax=Oscillochloris sp. ZM17-4 TaxID=2866714 RepID=UPI001C735BCF|nr:serine/threonine-protein kinase [Oscillochloris sp. ZM17-4]MBX0327652.1 serine/threonine protein kinase [Oscillochloris sp. ZM17-4]